MSGSACTQLSFHPKLPILEKNQYKNVPCRSTVDMLSQMVGVEILYGVLSEEHLGLQIRLIETARRLKAEEAKRKELETCLKRENPINLALAERIQALEESEAKLKRCNEDLREENDLLEFRLLEMEDTGNLNKRNVSTTSHQEADDVSDSGVTSLPTSDDEHHEFDVQDRDVKTRLMKMCQNVTNVSERICLQQCLALLRHYEARIEGLESTISAMCNEAIMSRSLPNVNGSNRQDGNDTESRSSGRIIATVLPFTESPNVSNCSNDGLQKAFGREACELSESGIFDNPVGKDSSTQTEVKEGGGDLSAELEKLSKIRERMEWSNNLPQPRKDIAFYEKRLDELEKRLFLYENSSDKHIRSIRAVIDQNVYLTAQTNHMNEIIERLKKEIKRLECEKSELDEIENETRFRCQRLEAKLTFVKDKKRRLKCELKELKSEMAERRDERDRTHTAKMEALVQTYERKNQELEEKELEVRYRLQMLENTMPALMMWNIWRMMMSVQTAGCSSVIPAGPGFVPISGNKSAGPSIGGKDISFSEMDAPIAQGPNTREEELIMKLRTLENKLNTQNRLLEESKSSEDELKSKLRELEKLMAKENVLSDIIDQEVDQDVELFEKLSRMAKERVEMDKRIKDLELKEKLYKETIEHADNFIAQLENKFDTQLKEKDNQMSEQAARLHENEIKLRAAERDSISSGILEEKVVALDSELKRLRDELTMKDKEKVVLEDAERQLLQELQEAMNELENMRGEIEGPLKAKIELSKKKSQAMEDELKASEQYKRKMEADHKHEVASLKNELMKLNHQLLENEVTIGELKEEVQTLEMAVEELRGLLSSEKANNEEVVKNLELKLEDKEREVESILKEKVQITTKSLKEELQEKIFSSEMIDQEIISAKGEFRFTTVKEMSEQENKENNDSVLLSQIISEEDLEQSVSSQTGTNLMTVFNKWKNLIPIGLTDITATQFQAFIAMVEQDDPQDIELAKYGLSRDFPLSKPGLPRECNIAQNAVANASGKDVKGTVDNLTKAYNHSKTCNSCNEKLGSFLEDIIKQLGVKLPQMKDLRGNQSEYLGEPSSLTTNELGPGSVGWDPNENEAGYKIKPTLSTLQLTVDELKEKCRVKDTLIKALADELRSDGHFNSNRLMEDITEYPSTDPPDFNRVTLHKFLNNEPTHELDTQDGEESYKATNALGLQVVRQVGPDSLLIKWNPPPPNKVYAFEIYVNGLFVQRIRSPGRTKTLLHPIELDDRIVITLNTLSYTGQHIDSAEVCYP
ncbi:uncharacterized protein PFB0145c isoform X1 [Cimex lectularius]|uniref:Uncharacterized protein n=1 Tax=Cimex lectularius TaxID=79782 RepID=A0A8I6SHA1_CIMLE|nr:uncharacterized protein PFB0145c isoform X1 [Cimex lectularius]